MSESSTSSNDALNDSLSFIKKLWAGMGVPGMQGVGMSIPTLSLEELDKRIQELRSVEAWLNLNVAMLNNAIRALEIQRTAVATLQSFSSALSQTAQMNEAGDTAQAHTGQDHEGHPENIPPFMRQSAEWWAGMQEQFKQALEAALEKNAAEFGRVKAAAEHVAAATAKPKAKPTKQNKAGPKSDES